MAEARGNKYVLHSTETETETDEDKEMFVLKPEDEANEMVYPLEDLMWVVDAEGMPQEPI